MTLKKLLLTIACLSIIPFCHNTATADAAIDMNEGLWEITTTTEMADMPFTIPPTINTSCLTKEDLIPKDDKHAQDDNCKITGQNISGDTVSWKIVCDSEDGQMTGAGSITYKGSNFDGAATIQIPNTGTVNQKMHGLRVGNCD